MFLNVYIDETEKFHLTPGQTWGWAFEPEISHSTNDH